MNLQDLKSNILDYNKEMETYLNSEMRIVYSKPTLFLYSTHTRKWRMANSKTIMVHPLFYNNICPNIINITLTLRQCITSKHYDSELILLSQIFKNNLFLISETLMEIDEEEEKNNKMFLTFEQLINLITFTYYHLYFLSIDNELFFLTDKDKAQYIKSINTFDKILERSSCLTWMLLKADEISPNKIDNWLLNLIENHQGIKCYSNYLDKYLNKMNG